MSKSSYYNSLIKYSRSLTSQVKIGNLLLGGDAPIRLQSMTNTDTNNTSGCVEQGVRILEAGGELVRLTAQGVKEAKNLKAIKERMLELGYDYPLVADIHFNPKAAFEAALHVDKVRINPGNFTDPVRRFDEIIYSDEEYAAELQKIREKFVPFLQRCGENHTAIRIGVNHGSLSDRIMSRYGDTAEGMVESCMEYLRIAKDEGFKHIVISIKSSNTRVMVHTVRLLVATMKDAGMNFPIHLGVTEAGEGEDGRIKSAVGIGALLNDGIGDTIRVSLSEDPEVEIPVAEKLLNHVLSTTKAPEAKVFSEDRFHSFDYVKDQSSEIFNVGGENLPVVIGRVFSPSGADTLMADWMFRDGYLINASDGRELQLGAKDCQVNGFQLMDVDDIDQENFKWDNLNQSIIVLSTHHANKMIQLRSAVFRLREKGVQSPVIFKAEYHIEDPETFQLAASSDLGGLFLDGLGDGIWLENDRQSPELLVKTSFGILQAARSRMSKTEFISCPGCGRTLFNLKPTIDKVRGATSHLKGLKIGIMGCIVNGPGEMADADYGYVGAGKGKISLYKTKECIERNIPEEEAVDRLIELIKREGDWKDPE